MPNWGGSGQGRRHPSVVRIWSWVMVLTGGALWTAVAEENSAQRLESAQSGMAEGSWPRKPDSRLSPLSGKMKESQEVSLKYYGKEREFPAKSAEGWSKEASFGKKSNWEGAADSRWEQARWRRDQDWAMDKSESEPFQPQAGLASDRTVTMREMERETAQGWSSRAAWIGEGRGGSLRMYEGRLTRVRQQVWQEDDNRNRRDLGPGREERFRPEDVEKILSQPVGDSALQPRGRSPSASPLATAGS